MLSKCVFLRAIFATATALVLALGSARAEANGDVKRNVYAFLEDQCDLTPNVFNQISRMIERDCADNQDFCITLGSESTKNGGAYQIHSFAGKFHVVRLTEVQAGKILQKPSSITYLNGRRSYEIGPDAAKVNTALLTNPEAHDNTHKVSGVVSVNVKEKIAGQYAVRMTYRVGGSCTQSLNHFSGSVGEHLVICNFSKFMGPKGASVTGPVVVFIDVVSIEEREDPTNFGVKTPHITVLSNSLPVLFNVVEPAPKPIMPTPPKFTDDFNPTNVRPSFPSPFTTSLVGTKWKFGGVDTTIEFLEGGIVRWNGEVELTTKWKQDGSQVTINANNFTLFKFTLAGNKLEGTWERMKGEDAGKTYPSSLTKID